MAAGLVEHDAETLADGLMVERLALRFEELEQDRQPLGLEFVCELILVARPPGCRGAANI